LHVTPAAFRAGAGHQEQRPTSSAQNEQRGRARSACVVGRADGQSGKGGDGGMKVVENYNCSTQREFLYHQTQRTQQRRMDLTHEQESHQIFHDHAAPHQQHHNTTSASSTVVREPEHSMLYAQKMNTSLDAAASSSARPHQYHQSILTTARDPAFVDVSTASVP
ncbi:unnamed protein product, partial [Amoebophrya sp. A120]